MKRIHVPAHRNPFLDRPYRRPPRLSDVEAQKHKIEHLDQATRALCEEHGIDPNAPDAIEKIALAELPRAVPALRDNLNPEPWSAQTEIELVGEIDAELAKHGDSPSVSRAARRLATQPKYSRFNWRTLSNRYHIAKRKHRVEAAA